MRPVCKISAAPIAALALTFGLLQTDTQAGLILKFLVSKLVYSTSNAAALFLLGFSGMALLFRQLKLSEGWMSSIILINWIGILLGYGIHLAATITYHLDNHIPFSAHVYHWSEGVNSYTALLHSHLGKSAIAISLGVLTGNSNYDTGHALAGALPLIQTLIIGVAFLAVVIATLLWMPVFHARFGHRSAHTLVYLVAAATVVKTILDGGLLSYSTPPALLLIGSYQCFSDELAWRSFWRRRGWLIGFIVLVSYAYLWFVLSADGNIPLIGPWLFYVIVLILFTITAWRGVMAWACRGILTAYLIVNFVFDYYDNLAPLLREVGPEYRAASFDLSGHPVLQPLDLWYGKPVFLAYRGLGDDPWKPRKTLLWEVPVHGPDTFKASLRLLEWEGDAGEIKSTPTLKIRQIAIASHEWIDIDFAGNSAAELPPIFTHGSSNALSKNNYYVWLYQVDLLLRRAGWRSYILLPHTVGNALTTAGGT